jgi:hypothetical protein
VAVEKWLLGSKGSGCKHCSEDLEPKTKAKS